MKLRYVITISFILIFCVALIAFLSNEYIGFFSAQTTSSILLWIGAISFAVALLSQFKDVIELTEKLFSRKSTKEKQNNNAIIPCDTPIIHGFGEIWFQNANIRNILRCPPSENDIEKETQIIFQSFERGEMIWTKLDSNDDKEVVYVLFEDDQTFLRIDNKLRKFNIGSLEQMYPTDYKIDGKFREIYWRLTSFHIKQRLGKPTSNSQSSYGACQQFEGGRMFWVNTTNNIYALLEYKDKTGEKRLWKKFPNVLWWKYQK